MIVNSNLSSDYTITPTITPTDKGNGTEQIFRVMYNSTNNNPVTVGAYNVGSYTKSKIIHSMRLANTETKLDIILHPAVLKQDYQGYKAGTVGFIRKLDGTFYGSNNPLYNFKEVE